MVTGVFFCCSLRVLREYFHEAMMTVSQKVKIRRLRKKLQIQGTQILRNEAYLWYAAMTRDAAQRRSWTFYKTVNDWSSIRPCLPVSPDGLKPPPR